MRLTHSTPRQKRAQLQHQLAGTGLLRFPGAFSPLVAMAIERQGWDGVYISGAALAADLGLPDVGLTTMTEVVARSRQIARVTDLPCLVDIDTGFGQPLNVARTVAMLEEAGVAGCHLEDQLQPKRCGHLSGKEVVPVELMVRKIAAAVGARRDPHFVIIARTDARATEGVSAAIARAKAYADAGATAIFPEALQDEGEFAAMGDGVAAPLIANMTEFGRSPLLPAARLEQLGYRIVIYPVTTLRLAMGAIERGLAELREHGSQESLLPRLQTRQQLYDLLRYRDYGALADGVADFEEP